MVLKHIAGVCFWNKDEDKSIDGFEVFLVSYTFAQFRSFLGGGQEEEEERWNIKIKC